MTTKEEWTLEKISEELGVRDGTIEALLYHNEKLHQEIDRLHEEIRQLQFEQQRTLQ